MILHTAILLIITMIYFIIYKLKKIHTGHKKKIFLIIVYIILFLIVGLRNFETGNDTINYLKFFDNTTQSKWNMLTTGHFEPGYVIFNIILSYFTTNSRLFLIITSFIFSTVIITFISKESKHPYISIIIYIGLLLFYYSMTMIRQFMAIMIIIYAYKYVKTRNLIKYILSILLACTFHMTAIIAIFIYPMYILKISKKIICIMISFSILLSFAIPLCIENILSIAGRTGFYSDRLWSYNVSNILYTLIYLILFIIFFKTLKKYNNKEQINDFYLLMILSSSCINLLGISMNVLSRLAMYYSIFTIIAVPNMIECINIKKIREKFYICLTLFLLLYSNTIIIFRPEWFRIDKYKMVFNIDNVERE